MVASHQTECRGIGGDVWGLFRERWWQRRKWRPWRWRRAGETGLTLCRRMAPGQVTVERGGSSVVGGGPQAAPMDGKGVDRRPCRMVTGRVDRPTLSPRQQQEVFGPEAYARYQAPRHPETRNESGTQYTVFSDSTAAISRLRRTERARGRFSPDPSSRSLRLATRGNSAFLRWCMPVNKGAGSNEVASYYTKATVESVCDAVSRRAHLTRKAAEARPLGTRN